MPEVMWLEEPRGSTCQEGTGRLGQTAAAPLGALLHALGGHLGAQEDQGPSAGGRAQPGSAGLSEVPQAGMPPLEIPTLKP